MLWTNSAKKLNELRTSIRKPDRRAGPTFALSPETAPFTRDLFTGSARAVPPAPKGPTRRFRGTISTNALDRASAVLGLRAFQSTESAGPVPS